MKKTYLFAALFLVPAISQARVIEEDPIRNCAPAITISVSTDTWNKITSSTTVSTLIERNGVKISNPSTNNASFYGLLSYDTPSEETSVRPIEVQTGENPWVPIGSDIDLWMISGHTSAESIHIQECEQ